MDSTSERVDMLERLVGRVYRERDRRFDRYVRVVEVNGDKAVVETVTPDASVSTGWERVFSNGRTTRIRLDNLTRPSRWEPQEVLGG